MNLEALKARLAELQAANESVIAACTTEGREATSEEEATIDANLAEIDRVKANIARLERITAGAAPGTRQVPQANGAGATGGTGGRPSVPAAPKLDARTMGFRNLGEFAICAKAAGGGDTGAQGRLQAAASEGADMRFPLEATWDASSARDDADVVALVAWAIRRFSVTRITGSISGGCRAARRRSAGS